MIRVALASLILLLVQVATAHDLDLTLIKVVRTGSHRTIEVSTPLSRLVRTAGLGDHPSGPALDVSIRERLNFGASSAAKLSVDSQSDVLTWAAKLEGNCEVASQRFDTSTPSARTIIASYDGPQLMSEVVIDGEVPKHTFSGMLGAGIHHIISGLDHILFVVGLALLGGGWKTILKVLSAFTVAHTLTLAAASLGLIHGDPKIVEPLIALSIVTLAIEGVRRSGVEASTNSWQRVAVAFGFGLVHGFGFAGGLTELGLQGSQLAQNLLFFSIGIELGQVLILAPTLLLIAVVARMDKVVAVRFRVAASVCLGMMGCFWFVERVL